VAIELKLVASELELVASELKLVAIEELKLVAIELKLVAICLNLIANPGLCQLVQRNVLTPLEFHGLLSPIKTLPICQRVQFLCSRIRKFRDLNSQFSECQNCSENRRTMAPADGPSVA
jgi:hypothetical protein